jgi:hypothetical protein
LVATGQVAPGSGGATFTGFSDLADDSFDQIFLATLSDGQEGLFERDAYGNTTNPPIVKIAETGDMVDGKTIDGIALSPDATGDDYYGTSDFELDFTDGSQGLYYFDISNLPEPAAFSLLALPLLFLRRRRSNKSAESTARSLIEPLEQRRLLSLSVVTIGVNAHAVFSADDSGSTDASGAIQNAINSVSSVGGVVYLPDGTMISPF